MNITLKELKDFTEISAIYPLIKQRNTTLSKSEFDDLLRDMLSMGYRCVAAYGADEQIIGVSGFWIKSQFYCRKSMRIDNFIVDEHQRGQGIGKKMLKWLQEEGKRNNCSIAILDSLTGNTQSHRFYFREGFNIIGFHFAKDL